MAKVRSSRSSRKRLPLLRSLFSLLFSLLLGGVLLGAAGLGLYMLYLDGVIRSEFDQKRWALPAKVYARPLELFSGMPLSADAFAQELKLLRYRDANCPLEPAPPPETGKRTIKRKSKRSAPEICAPPPGGGESLFKPGSYARRGEIFEVMTRDFVFWDGAEPARKVRVTFAGNILVDVVSLDEREAPGLLRLDPPEIAGIYPAHYEDRILLNGKDLPPALVDTLLAVEDRSFFEHAGVNPKGIFRALLANLRAGRTVQGGSTLTQQLVKNLFLSNERSIKRKINEILMAILIDARYGKDDILEAYSNAIYLGQDGSRAIHGFGLASQFFFGEPLEDLDLHQLALLVGMIKGPSLYDPRKHPERARERRDLVLDIMAEQNLIGPEDAAVAKEMPLDVTLDVASGITAYPAFLELVQRQLRQYYKPEDLVSEGLRVFTTLDPRLQAIAENTHGQQPAGAGTEPAPGAAAARRGGRDRHPDGRSAGDGGRPRVEDGGFQPGARRQAAGRFADQAGGVSDRAGAAGPLYPDDSDQRQSAGLYLRRQALGSRQLRQALPWPGDPARRVGPLLQHSGGAGGAGRGRHQGGGNAPASGVRPSDQAVSGAVAGGAGRIALRHRPGVRDHRQRRLPHSPARHSRGGRRHGQAATTLRIWMW